VLGAIVTSVLASAVQIGTANFYRPGVSMTILDALPGALAELGAKSIAEVIGTLNSTAAANSPIAPAKPVHA